MGKLLFDAQGKLIGKGVSGSEYVAVKSPEGQKIRKRIREEKQEQSVVKTVEVPAPNVTQTAVKTPAPTPTKRSRGNPANTFSAYDLYRKGETEPYAQRQIRRKGSKSSIVDVPYKEKIAVSTYDVYKGNEPEPYAQRSYRNVKGSKSLVDTPYYTQGEQILNYLDETTAYASTLKEPKNPASVNVPTGKKEKWYEKSMTFPEFGAYLNEKISAPYTKTKKYEAFLLTGDISPRVSYGKNGKTFSGFLQGVSSKPEGIQKTETFVKDFRKGFIREGAEKPLQTAGIVSTGAFIGMGAGAIANTGKAGLLSVKLIGGTGLGLYAGSAVAGATLSENKGEYLGRETFKLSAYSFGASLVRSPITKPNKQDIKTGIRQGGFEDYSNKELKSLFGNYAVKARTKATADFSSQMAQGTSEGFKWDIKGSARIPVKGDILAGKGEIQINKYEFLSSRTLPLSNEAQTTLSFQSSGVRSLRTIEPPRLKYASSIQNALSQTYDYSGFKTPSRMFEVVRLNRGGGFLTWQRQAKVNEFTPKVFIKGQGLKVVEAPDYLYGLSPSKKPFLFNKKATLSIGQTTFSKQDTGVYEKIDMSKWSLGNIFQQSNNPYSSSVQLNNLRLGSTLNQQNDLFIGQRNGNVFIGVASMQPTNKLQRSKTLNITKQLDYTKTRITLLPASSVVQTTMQKSVPMPKPPKTEQKQKYYTVYQTINIREPRSPNIQPPEYVPPVTPPPLFIRPQTAGFDLESSPFKSFYSGFKTSYTPSFGAVSLGIYGKPNLQGARTGIGLRPISIKKMRLAI